MSIFNTSLLVDGFADVLDEMTLINYSIIDPRMKCIVDIGVSYDTDIDFARKVIIEEAYNCPCRDRNGEDEPIVMVKSHGDFSIRT